MVQCGTRRVMGQEDTASVSFTDLLSKKVIKNISLPVTLNNAGDNYEIRHFSSGEIYLIFHKIKNFKINQTALTAEDVSTSLFAQHLEMSSGIAKAAFHYAN